MIPKKFQNRSVSLNLQRLATNSSLRRLIKRAVMAGHGHGVLGDRVTTAIFRLMRLREL